MIVKNVESGEVARQKLIKGVDTVANAVGTHTHTHTHTTHTHTHTHTHRSRFHGSVDDLQECG
jgi:hypothetical protein